MSLQHKFYFAQSVSIAGKNFVHKQVHPVSDKIMKHPHFAKYRKAGYILKSEGEQVQESMAERNQRLAVKLAEPGKKKKLAPPPEDEGGNDDESADGDDSEENGNFGDDEGSEEDGADSEDESDLGDGSEEGSSDEGGQDSSEENEIEAAAPVKRKKKRKKARKS